MNTVREASVRVMPPGTSSRNRLAAPVTCRRCRMNTVREAAVRVMPPGTSSRNRLAAPVTCRRCGMNTVREAAVRAMPPDADVSDLEGMLRTNEAAA